MRLQTKLKGMKNLREFLNGMVLNIYAEGILVNLYSSRENTIIKGGVLVPNVFLDLGKIVCDLTLLDLREQQSLGFLVNFSLKNIKAVDNKRIVPIKKYEVTQLDDTILNVGE